MSEDHNPQREQYCQSLLENKEQRKQLQVAPREVQVGHDDQFVPLKSCPGLSRAARAVVEFPSLEGFKSHGDVLLRAVV